MYDVAPSEEEGLRKLLKPNISKDQLLQAIRQSYPGVSIIYHKELDSYDDRNFLLSFDSKLCVAKVFNGLESAKYIRASKAVEESKDKNTSTTLSAIHLLHAIFSHLKNPQYDVRTSFPLSVGSSGTGRSVHSFPVVSESHSPTLLVIQLLEWVEGQTMSSVSNLSLETLADAGQYLGKVCLALDDLTSQDDVARKAADRYHLWDGKNTLHLEKFVHSVTNDRRRRLVNSVLETFRSELVDNPDKPNFRKGIMHADYNDANIILDGNKVCGVIDFNDSTFSWRVLDISTAMAYAMISNIGKTNRSIAAAAAILRGFHSIYPLTNTEQKYLRLLTASRLSCSATIGSYSYQQNPENKYLLHHSEPAWKALELLWSGEEEMSSAIDNFFAFACTSCPNANQNIDCEASALIDCADISFPDPIVVDALRSVRLKTKGDIIYNDPSSEYLKKRPKVSHDDCDGPLITFVTGNIKKLEEVQRIMSSMPSSRLVTGENHTSRFNITNRKIDLPELQGDPLEIAKEKCSIAAKEIGGAVITEDTSLCFSALHGMPGPYIKWFLERCGHSGLNNMIAFSDDKSAYAQTVVGYCPCPEGKVTLFDGRTQGKIVYPRGPLDFGWDPIFEPDEGGGKTYAEMDKDEKNAISHRSRAFAKLKSFLVDMETT